MIIDTYYEGVLAKLTKQGKIKLISQELISQKTNTARVLFVYKILEELGDFPSVQELQKNNDLSTQYRNLGNKCFEKTQYHKAWQYYNISLMNACKESENYCLALSNRSAVFYEINKYDECIKDIDEVFKLEYPQRLTQKLKNRKQECEQKQRNQNQNKKNVQIDLDDILKMKHDKDSSYVAASTKLQVVTNKEMGRHVIAKEDVSVGEIIIEEDSYVTLLQKSQYLFSCAYCLSRSLNLLPCDSCCFSLYCSDECKAKAWNDYHKIECRLMNTLIEMDFTKLELLALRTVIKARTDHKDWNDLFQTIQDAEANIDTEYQGHVKIDDKWVYDSSYYASIHTLSTNVERRSISDMFQKAVSAAVFLRYLKDNTTFLQATEQEESRNFECVAGLLLLHLMTTPTNMHGISSIIGDSSGKFVEDLNLASAPYAFCSLLNHSCSPNVVRYHKLGSAKMLVFALRPIKKGMQIFDNYGPHHAIEDQRSRQATLTFQYKFTCTCEACINKWPTYMLLSMFNTRKVPSRLVNMKNRILSQNTIDKLQHGDMKTAINIYKDLCDLCEKLEPYAPCMELCDCQESLKQCVSMFQGFVPYGNSLMVTWKPVSTTR